MNLFIACDLSVLENSKLFGIIFSMVMAYFFKLYFTKFVTYSNLSTSDCKVFQNSVPNDNVIFLRQFGTQFILAQNNNKYLINVVCLCVPT